MLSIKLGDSLGDNLMVDMRTVFRACTEGNLCLELRDTVMYWLRENLRARLVSVCRPVEFEIDWYMWWIVRDMFGKKL